MARLPNFSTVISTSSVSSPSHTGLYDPIYAPALYTSELVLLINLCCLCSLCHYHKFLFDRKHRWVQEKLVLLFHFPPDWYLLSHANPLTPVMTSGPPTPFTITNVSLVIQGNNASTLGTLGNRCVDNYAFCNHLFLYFRAFRWNAIKRFRWNHLPKIYKP